MYPYDVKIKSHQGDLPPAKISRAESLAMVVCLSWAAQNEVKEINVTALSLVERDHTHGQEGIILFPRTLPEATSLASFVNQGQLLTADVAPAGTDVFISRRTG